MNKSMLTNHSMSLILITLAICSIGCGSAGPSPVDVSGNISIDGKPLNQGAIIFTDAKGKRAYGEIHSDGSFVVGQVVPGEFRVAVNVPKRRRVANQESDRERGARPQPVSIPNRYGDVDSSGLQFEITPESHDLNIELDR